MKAIFKKTLKSIFPRLYLRRQSYRKLIRNQQSYLYASGWMRSLEEMKPVDSEGRPVPWMNYSMIRILEEKLTKNINLFEFGSGYSTYFYANRVNTVTSVEYDRKWLEIVESKAPENVSLIFVAEDVDGNYCRTISSAGKPYDVIIVDGRDRVNCVKQGFLALTPGGVLVLDDSQRERYLPAIDFALGKGFKVLNIEGLKTTGNGVSKTSIFYRENNCLGI